MSNSEFLSSFSRISERSLFHTKEVLSLAKLQISIFLKNKNKPFKYILKKKFDSNTDPYGKPYNILSMS